MHKACFSSSLRSDRSANASRPKSAVADFVEQGFRLPDADPAPPSRFDSVGRIRVPLKRDGGAGGIRTLDTAFQPYNGLANRRLQPLGHSSIQNFSAALPAEDRHHAAARGKGALLP